MVEWHRGKTSGRKPGTWGWLIGRYKSDEFSSIFDVRPGTRETYKKVLAKIETGIGEVLISETDYPCIKEWERQMQKKGRSTSYIKKWFTHWGLALSHGVKLGDQDCVRIKAIRSEMRIKSPARREIHANREQIEKIVETTDQLGLYSASLAILLRFELMLRGVDVYGQWEPAEGREGGIRHGDKLWVDGITWDMVNSDLTSITKVISKTRETMPDPYCFDLTPLPDIRRRLAETPPEKRTGPLILGPDDLPPKSDWITKTFKRMVRKLELPDHLRISDSRSGGITEARSIVDPYTLQHAAQHSQQSTTDIYVRGKSQSANKVIDLRSKR